MPRRLYRPPTFAVRPLAVISIVDQVAKQPGYRLSVEDIQRWGAAHGRIPEGAVVFVRSDGSKAWPDPALATRRPFPGVSLTALRVLHEQRHILFHRHEPLDTDTTEVMGLRFPGQCRRMVNGLLAATVSIECLLGNVRSPGT